MAAEDTKNRILACTIELINELNGDIENVTIRTIANRAGIGVGLTNHYFKSKDILIAECVNSVFRDIFNVFMPSDYSDENAGPMEATMRSAHNLMRFFIQNEALTRVAINLEAKNPTEYNYTTKLVNSFAYAMVDRKKMEDMLTNDRLSDKMKQQFREHIISEQRIKAFMLTATLKDAFLRKDSFKETIGVDIKDEEQCDEYIDELIGILM